MGKSGFWIPTVLDQIYGLVRIWIIQTLCSNGYFQTRVWIGKSDFWSPFIAFFILRYNFIILVMIYYPPSFVWIFEMTICTTNWEWHFKFSFDCIYWLVLIFFYLSLGFGSAQLPLLGHPKVKVTKFWVLILFFYVNSNHLKSGLVK